MSALILIALIALFLAYAVPPLVADSKALGEFLVRGGSDDE